MLSKQSKLDLRSKKDFFSVCKKTHSPYFSFFYKKNDKEGLKIVVVVPKKTVKLATKRNEVKRKFYLSIEEVLKNSKKIKDKNIDLVVVTNKKGIEEKSSSLIKIIKGSLLEIVV